VQTQSPKAAAEHVLPIDAKAPTCACGSKLVPFVRVERGSDLYRWVRVCDCEAAP
jgi:hypothetical protein